ncbi:MAG: hypothetical protein ACOYEW_02645 [Anaerolineae bacterium]|jgi:hypothetical protein
MAREVECAPGLVRSQSLASLQSAINKSEKALARMAQKGASTALVAKRLKALQVGLAVLESVWNHRPHHYTQGDLTEACTVLVGMLPSVERIYARSRPGSPQRTLLERRITALSLALQAIEGEHQQRPDRPECAQEHRP